MEVSNVLIFSGCALLCLIAFLYYKRRKSLENTKKEKEVIDIFKFEDAIRYFKQERIITILKENPSYLAVVVKSKNENGYYTLVMTVFDEKGNSCLEGTTVTAKKLDDMASQQFGDKDMLVLK